MYAEERQSAIADLVTRDRRLSVSEAAQSFGVTTETVRRDLAVLERQGLIHRVHGGAVPPDALTILEPAVSERDVTAADEKDRIARAALDLLPGRRRQHHPRRRDHDRPAGPLLPQDRRLTVVTNAAPIAAIITSRSTEQSELELHILGGRVRPESQVSVGGAALAALHDLRVDVSFIGVNGFTIQHGLHTPNHDEASVKSAMISAGRRVDRADRLTQVRRREPGAVRPARPDRRRRHRRRHQRRRHQRPRSPRHRCGDRMIVTLTANPSVDRTMQLDSPIVRGEVFRATSVGDEAGGKGVNVAARNRSCRRAGRRGACPPTTTTCSSRA